MLKLRPHHLLCLSLFEGKGYDNAFTENMADVLRRLASENSFTLAEGRDDICAACPNLTEQGHCALGDTDVQRMDRVVVEFLKLEYSKQYEYGLVVGMLRETMTEEHFLACCGGCGWHSAQVCTYPKLMEKLSAE